MTLLVYSSLLAVTFVLGAPYWIGRMIVSGRYRAGLAGRLGRIAGPLREAVRGRKVIWLHAVSVGEVLAATRLVEELQKALPGVLIAVSTTTETGQALARSRFPDSPVFYLPLDFGFLMRRYLRVFGPSLVLLMESELWPNMIHECRRAGIPLAVVNARVSDRSFPRYIRLRPVWGPLLREVTLFLAQSDETARRLKRMGVTQGRIRMTGNLKYDIRAPRPSLVVELIRDAVGGRRLVVAGSTVADRTGEEEVHLMQHWYVADAVLVIAPRHPERFTAAYSVMQTYGPVVRATELLADDRQPVPLGGSILLDTIGDLAALYRLADVAFIGGSLVRKGGHNPLEAAQYGVPVLMGPSYENFREIVEQMRRADGIAILEGPHQLDPALTKLLTDVDWAKTMGERGRRVFEAQAGATARTVAALMELLP